MRLDRMDLKKEKFRLIREQSESAFGGKGIDTLDAKNGHWRKEGNCTNAGHLGSRRHPSFSAPRVSCRRNRPVARSQD